MKTLTDVTPYTDFVKKTLSLFDTKVQMLLSKMRMKRNGHTIHILPTISCMMCSWMKAAITSSRLFC